MGADQLRDELYAANKNRAILYELIYSEMAEELGEERAADIMKRAIYKRGEQIGERFAEFAPDNFEGLKNAFIGGIPDEGRMFQPEVTKCDSTGLEISFYACPLKTAWQEMGYSEEKCAKLCEIAGIIDYGTFENAGFAFDVRALPQGEKDCCYLKIWKKE